MRHAVIAQRLPDLRPRRNPGELENLSACQQRVAHQWENRLDQMARS